MSPPSCPKVTLVFSRGHGEGTQCPSEMEAFLTLHPLTPPINRLRGGFQVGGGQLYPTIVRPGIIVPLCLGSGIGATYVLPPYRELVPRHSARLWEACQAQLPCRRGERPMEMGTEDLFSKKRFRNWKPGLRPEAENPECHSGLQDKVKPAR